MAKLPPLRCPQCQSTCCSKSSGGTIWCEGCYRKTDRKGKSKRFRRDDFIRERGHEIVEPGKIGGRWVQGNGK